MVSLKPVIYGVRENECVARLVRGRSVKPFNHQIGSNPITLTTLVELGLRGTAGYIPLELRYDFSGTLNNF